MTTMPACAVLGQLGMLCFEKACTCNTFFLFQVAGIEADVKKWYRLICCNLQCRGHTTFSTIFCLKERYRGLQLARQWDDCCVIV